MKITILGVRGSIPTDGHEMSGYGGATSCVMIETDKSVIFLDAGTGITGAPVIDNKSVSVLLTHPHADHLMGLPFFPYMIVKDKKIDIYASAKNGMGTREQVESFISPPLWPCTLKDYPAIITCHDAVFPFKIDDVEIFGMESNHPGGGTIFKLVHDGCTVVYATDYEHSDDKDEELIRFCDGSDLLLYDGQYTSKEYEGKKGYGHSTPEHGLMIMEKSKTKTLRIVHHDPHHTDDVLREMEGKIRSVNAAFARQGETICLQR
ncbi:MAG: MBL fold metallo-hydrolase [Lachnospiraceae bacterium]|nr:MBL fold metallo-hydrolase [Lachnospiraceae bacterium]